MARYKFQCINNDCEKHHIEFSAIFPMADVGKTELYPKCECCGHITEKIFAPNGNFQLKGMRWMNTPGGYSGGVDVTGRPLGNSIQIGGDFKG